MTSFETLVSRFDKVRIAVVGDIFLDRLFYVRRDWDELSVETGLTAYQVGRRICTPGAAGVITNNLGSLKIGARYAVALTGADGEGYDLRRSLEATGCDTHYMVAEDGRFTPTYTKTFFERENGVEETHRIDLKNRMRMTEETERAIIRNLLELEEKVDAFVCLEQLEHGDFGVFTAPVIETLSEISQRGKARVFVDSRFNIRKFKNMIQKCNDNEVLRVAGFPFEFDGPFDAERNGKVEDAMRMMRTDARYPMFVTCGKLGMKVLDEEKILTVPAYHVEGPVDICGAGDSAMAGIACALCAGATLPEAALMGNLVASIIVEQIGVTGTATREQLLRRYEQYQAQRSE